MPEEQDKYEPGSPTDFNSTSGVRESVRESASMLTSAEIRALTNPTAPTTIEVPASGLPVFVVAPPDTGGGYDYRVYTTEREALLAALHYLGDDMDEAAKIESLALLEERMDDMTAVTGDYVAVSSAWLYAEPPKGG